MVLCCTRVFTGGRRQQDSGGVLRDLMMPVSWRATLGIALALAMTPAVVAADDQPTSGAATVQTVTCAAKAGERQACPADTSAGVVLVKSDDSGKCLLGKTWGYDDKGIWVSDGCSGEFVVGPASALATPSAAGPPAAAAAPREPERPSYGTFDASGTGFLVGRSGFGELKIGGYALLRYINQTPGEQQFTDHLGNVHTIDPRRDIQFHRAMIHFRGWLFSPKFRYQITSWTVMSTDQTTLYGLVGYQFHKAFNLYAGTNSLGGSRSLYGSHPFWLANDRVMADELFRGGFTNGVWANGEVLPGLWYNVAVGNNFSQLGISAKQLNRGLATGGSVWWLPTTHEFGPNSSYDDWEYHEKLATRIGFTTARSREDRQMLSDNSPENTQIRLADSTLLFDAGSLAPGVTVNQADVRLLSFDAGIKYHGIFAQAEFYHRTIDGFDADGPLPMAQIVDKGFYVQAAFYPIKQKLELYAATSWVFGDKDAGFSDSHEFLGGANVFWFKSRNIRSNFQVINVDRSAASSTFGFYVGGQKGTTYSIATSFLF
jgi:hypothetical protein